MVIERPPSPNAEMAAIASAAEAADGVSPLNELGWLAVHGERAAQFYATEAAFAVRDAREGTAQLVVHPDHRRRGLGRDVATAVLTEYPSTKWWAFGNLPGAIALAEGLGLHCVRQLLLMTRPLTPLTPIAPEPPITIGPYSTQDAPAIVEVNGLAFAHHPEQGNLTLDDFVVLASQPWFDPDGLLVARDGDRVLGFHWTKRHSASEGEVYVLAVHPDAEGRGLGRALLEAGLDHLQRQGCDTVKLYVESSAKRVVNLYLSASFGISAVDALYAASKDSHD